MAEIAPQTDPKSKQKKKPTKVDMTAMVDVAFLLLTFFILTTTLLSPVAIEIVKPTGIDSPALIDREKILTLIPGEGDQIHYYHGEPGGELLTTDYSEVGIREVIYKHQKRHSNRCAKGEKDDCWDPIFVIKPNSNCRYKNVVDILDEMRVCNVRKYSYTGVTSVDSMLLALNEKH